MTFSEDSFNYDNGISKVKYEKGLKFPNRAFFSSEQVGYYGINDSVVGGEIAFYEI